MINRKSNGCWLTQGIIFKLAAQEKQTVHTLINSAEEGVWLSQYLSRLVMEAHAGISPTRPGANYLRAKRSAAQKKMMHGRLLLKLLPSVMGNKTDHIKENKQFF